MVKIRLHRLSHDREDKSSRNKNLNDSLYFQANASVNSGKHVGPPGQNWLFSNMLARSVHRGRMIIL